MCGGEGKQNRGSGGSVPTVTAAAAAAAACTACPQVSYRSYWTRQILEVLRGEHKASGLSIKDISDKTAIRTGEAGASGGGGGGEGGGRGPVCARAARWYMPCSFVALPPSPLSPEHSALPCPALLLPRCCPAADDVVKTLEGLSLIKYWKGDHIISVTHKIVEEHLRCAGEGAWWGGGGAMRLGRCWVGTRALLLPASHLPSAAAGPPTTRPLCPPARPPTGRLPPRRTSRSTSTACTGRPTAPTASRTPRSREESGGWAAAGSNSSAPPCRLLICTYRSLP